MGFEEIKAGGNNNFGRESSRGSEQCVCVVFLLLVQREYARAKHERRRMFTSSISNISSADFSSARFANQLYADDFLFLSARIRRKFGGKSVLFGPQA